VNRAAELAVAAHRRFLGTPYFPAFDGLRCIAISAVIWHHSLPRALPGWIGRGHVGVPLFFALSGFLITSLLLGEARKTGGVALGAFWMRRCLRIFPLYYGVLGLFALSLLLRSPSEGRRHFFDSLPFYASYTSNWFVNYSVPHPVWFGFAWSLATEEQFYAWWPPLLRRCQRWGSAAMGCALLAVIALDQLAEHGAFGAWATPEGVAQRMLTSLAASMSLGALLAVLMADQRAFVWLWRLLGWRATAPGCALLLGTWVWQPTGPFIVFELLLAVLVAACAASPPSWLTRALSTRPLVQIGRVSYGMYLFHVPVLGLLRRSMPGLIEHPVWLFPLALLGSFGLAAVSYRYIEAPLLALKERFRPSCQPVPRASATPEAALGA
jgi:peptidoglycan/LPS O-acetylase OafA/YrhL